MKASADDNVVEIRLTDRNATTANIAKTVHRHLKARNLTRIEVHYSTQSRVPARAEDIRQRLATYMERAGERRTPISIRKHENELDNVTGEHWVRLIYDGQPQATQHKAPSWLQRVLPRWLLAAMGFAPSQGLSGKDGHPANAISQQQAVATLQRALAQGCTAYRAAGNTLSPQAAQINVRHDGLHQALQGLASNETQLAKWVANSMRPQRLFAAPNFVAHYHFDAPVEGDSTVYVLAGDVEVTLTSTTTSTGHNTGSTRAAGDHRREPTLNADSDETLLPVGSMPEPNRSYSVAVVAVGSTPLPKPFEVPLIDRAEINRNYFADSAFAKTHPDLLNTISRSVALMVRADPSGAVISAGRHPSTGQAAYYLLGQDGAARPIAEEIVVDSFPVRIFLNAPQGVASKGGGRTIPPVVIELRYSETNAGAKDETIDPEATLLPH